MSVDPQCRRYRTMAGAPWILAIYIFAAWLFMGLSPAQSLGNPELVMTAPPVHVQAMILVFFIILQFGAMFWFLSRATTT